MKSWRPAVSRAGPPVKGGVGVVDHERRRREHALAADAEHQVRRDDEVGLEPQDALEAPADDRREVRAAAALGHVAGRREGELGLGLDAGGEIGVTAAQEIGQEDEAAPSTDEQ
jgi:hypothetical protein